MSFPNWFDGSARANFARFLLPNRANYHHCLQIGAFTGDATLWLLENLPEAVINDVDPWLNYDVLKGLELADAEAVYDARILHFKERVNKHKMTSDKFFRGCTDIYDFIYIDGDHAAMGVLQDSINADRHLSPGGLLAFDDYLWTARNDPYEEPRLGIDAFLRVYKKRYEVLLLDYQVWLRKL